MKYESTGERAERVDTQAGLRPDLGDLWLLWCLGASGKGQKVPPILKGETSAQERASHKDCCIESKEGSSVRMWEIVGMVLATTIKMFHGIKGVRNSCVCLTSRQGLSSAIGGILRVSLEAKKPIRCF